MRVAKKAGTLGAAQYPDDVAFSVKYRYGYGNSETFFQNNQTEDRRNIGSPVLAYPFIPVTVGKVLTKVLCCPPGSLPRGFQIGRL